MQQPTLIRQSNEKLAWVDYRAVTSDDEVLVPFPEKDEKTGRRLARNPLEKMALKLAKGILDEDGEPLRVRDLWTRDAAGNPRRCRSWKEIVLSGPSQKEYEESLKRDWSSLME